VVCPVRGWEEGERERERERESVRGRLGYQAFFCFSYSLDMCRPKTGVSVFQTKTFSKYLLQYSCLEK
jgi:hypothetical protein